MKINRWLNVLRHDAILSLLASEDKAVVFFAERDLLDKTISIEQLWQLTEVQRILKRQKPNGSWQYPGGKEKIRTQENYNQIETYRNLGILIEKFGFNKKHPAISKAAEYLFSFQTKEGDFRGIYGNQYSPNYSGGITELLIKAGYEKDLRVEKVFKWLVSIRQTDGGWAIPFRTRGYKLDIIESGTETIETDSSKPFSHLVTGVVLRAFAAHSTYRHSKEVQKAGQLLISSIFQKDNYPDRAASTFWFGFTFPFWFTDLLSALDSLSLLGFSKEEPQLDKSLNWFVKNQQQSGLWKLRILKGQNKDITQLWLSLAICRIFKGFYD